MTTYWPLFTPTDQFFDDSGSPLAGGFLRFYVTGTSTNQSVYLDPLGTTKAGFKIKLNGEGRPPHVLYLLPNTEYRVKLLDEDETELSSTDNIIGNSLGIADDLSEIALAKFATTDANVLIGYPSGVPTALFAGAPLSISSSTISATAPTDMHVFGAKTAVTNDLSSAVDYVTDTTTYFGYVMYIIAMDISSSTTDTEFRASRSSSIGAGVATHTATLSSEADTTRNTTAISSASGDITSKLEAAAANQYLAFGKIYVSRNRSTSYTTALGGTFWYQGGTTDSNRFTVSNFRWYSSNNTTAGINLTDGGGQVGTAWTHYQYKMV